MPEETVVERRAIRAILLTPDREVLLMRIAHPDVPDPFWITPGGGIKADESVETGLRRELQEELGLTTFEIGPLVWRRQHTFTWAGERICQREEYRIVHVDRFEPVMNDDVEFKTVSRFHWWTVAELKDAQERLTPLSLASIVDRYIEHGAPAEELVMEVTVD